MAVASSETFTDDTPGGELDDDVTYSDMQVLAFGLQDPCEWAATLHTCLLRAAQSMQEARMHHEDPSKDISHSTEEAALTGVRKAVGQYLAELYVMLHSMPLMQRRPEVLEALQFIIAGLADVDRGAAPAWLAPKRTKKHLKTLNKERYWVRLIVAMELLLLHERFANIHAAASELHRLTGEPVGTVKDWHTRLSKQPTPARADAKATIDEEVSQMRAVFRARPGVDRNAIIEARVKELLS